MIIIIIVIITKPFLLRMTRSSGTVPSVGTTLSDQKKSDLRECARANDSQWII